MDEIFWHHRRRYGARRISVELSRRGVARVARLVKTRGLQAIQPKPFRPRSTESRHRLGKTREVLQFARTVQVFLVHPPEASIGLENVDMPFSLGVDETFLGETTQHVHSRFVSRVRSSWLPA